MAQNDMTSDPWDDFGDPTSPVTETHGPVLTGNDEPEIPHVPAPPAPPPIPVTEELDSDDLSGHGDDFGGPAVDAAPAPDSLAEIDVPDFDDGSGSDMAESDLSAPEIPEIPDAPQFDAPTMGFGDALEIPDLDLAGIGGAEVDFPAEVAADQETVESVESEPDVSDLDIPDFGGDDDAPSSSDELPGASEQHTITRTPFSPMFAATGIFGDGGTTDSADEAAADDLESDANDLDFAPSTPPAVYAELEELSGGRDDLILEDEAVEVEAGGETSYEVDGGDIALGDSDAPTDEHTSEDATDFTLAEDEADPIDDEVLGYDNPTDESSAEEDQAVLGSATESPIDEDFQALAAMVADVDPIVMGDEPDAKVDNVPLDTDDWLSDDEPQDGFDIGITLGTGADDEPGAGEDPVPTDPDPDQSEELSDSHATGLDELEFSIDEEFQDIPSEPSAPVDIFARDLQAFAVAPDIESGDAAEEATEPSAAEPLVDTNDEVPEVASFDDLNAVTDAPSSADAMESDGPEVWGARWKESAQGWVEDEHGASIWRPIVTTSSTLSEWEVDTYLGVVVGDSALDAAAATAHTVAESRELSTRRMMDEALARGAHAVVGVSHTVQPLGSEVLVTASGTAVTLKADAPI